MIYIFLNLNLKYFKIGNLDFWLHVYKEIKCTVDETFLLKLFSCPCKNSARGLKYILLSLFLKYFKHINWLYIIRNDY